LEHLKTAIAIFVPQGSFAQTATGLPSPVFNSLQLSISLMRLIGPSIFLPKTPANTWPLPLLIVFK
jgi:hypothetical protein